MPRRTTPSLEAAVAEFQEMRTINVAPTTHYNDGRLLAKFVRDVGAGQQVHTITARQVEKWCAGEAARLRAGSFNKSRNRLSTFFSFCRNRTWMDIDPLAFVGRQKEVKRDRFRLSPSELLELPDHARTERDRAFVTMAMNTGLRAGDLVNLRVRDVDLNNGWLRVFISKSSIEDQLPITNELDTALRRWFKHYVEDAGELQPDWRLFPRREPGRGRFINEAGKLGGIHVAHIYGELLPTLPMKNPAEIIQRCLTDAGHVIEAGEGVHTVRRSVARSFFDYRVAAGHDGALRETAALLHHKNVSTTEGYLGITTEKLGRDRALRGKPFLTAMTDAGQPQARLRATS